MSATSASPSVRLPLTLWETLVPSERWGVATSGSGSRERNDIRHQDRGRHHDPEDPLWLLRNRRPALRQQLGRDQAFPRLHPRRSLAVCVRMPSGKQCAYHSYFTHLLLDTRSAATVPTQYCLTTRHFLPTTPHLLEHCSTLAPSHTIPCCLTLAPSHR